MFNEPALNTFDSSIAQSRLQAGNALVRTVDVECIPLAEVIRRHRLSENPRNSFLSVEVEGPDLQVLRSNNWSIFKPSVIVAEDGGKTIGQLLTSEIASYLSTHGYELFSKLGHSVFSNLPTSR